MDFQLILMKLSFYPVKTPDRMADAWGWLFCAFFLACAFNGFVQGLKRK